MMFLCIVYHENDTTMTWMNTSKSICIPEVQIIKKLWIFFFKKHPNKKNAKEDRLRKSYGGCMGI